MRNRSIFPYWMVGLGALFEAMKNPKGLPQGPSLRKVAEVGNRIRTGQPFERNGRKYVYDAQGTIHRLTPKPWESKAERRQVIKMRRAFRGAGSGHDISFPQGEEVAR